MCGLNVDVTIIYVWWEFPFNLTTRFIYTPITFLSHNCIRVCGGVLCKAKRDWYVYKKNTQLYRSFTDYEIINFFVETVSSEMKSIFSKICIWKRTGCLRRLLQLIRTMCLLNSVNDVTPFSPDSNHELSQDFHRIEIPYGLVSQNINTVSD